MAAEATVKVRVGDQVMHTAADGNGPVNALDAAVRKALLPFYPRLADVHLTDYKVRILDGDSGHGGPDAGAHRFGQRAPHLEHGGQLDQHHRGQLAGAGRQPGVCTAEWQ